MKSATAVQYSRLEEALALPAPRTAFKPWLVTVVFCLVLLAPLRPAIAADNVTEWTQLAHAYGGGGSNGRTLAIMHQAMHDALNAAQPTYARWAPPAADEPPANGSLPHTAMYAAAHRVLLLLHPSQKVEIEFTYQMALARDPAGPDRDAGERLGDAIGAAAVARREKDGHTDERPFAFGSGPGAWTFTPNVFQNSNVSSMRPFLFDSGTDKDAPPPPALDSDAYRANLDEVRRLGGAKSTERTPVQTEAAFFWAFQSTQIGYVSLAVGLLDEMPRPGGEFDHARIMSQITSAMADSAVLTWNEKERFNFWRPVTAIRAGGPGVEADPSWLPLIETPPFPEYPAGHGTDCFTGSMVLQDAFGPDLSAVTYQSQAGDLRLSMTIGADEHVPLGGDSIAAQRPFPSLIAAAEECAQSRIWAGVHFRSANDESRRLGTVIAKKAAAAVSPLK